MLKSREANKQATSLKNQKGFTLVEMVIVVVMLGILASVVASQFAGSVTSGGRAQAMYSVADKMRTSWTSLTQNQGVSTDPDSSPVINSGNSAEDIIFMGSDYVATGYETAYNSSGIRPLGDAIVVETAPSDGSEGTYALGSSTLSITDVSGGKFTVQFTDVDTATVESLWTKHMAGTYDGTVASNSGKIQFPAAASGQHATVDIVLFL